MISQTLLLWVQSVISFLIALLFLAISQAWPVLLPLPGGSPRAGGQGSVRYGVSGSADIGKLGIITPDVHRHCLGSRGEVVQTTSISLCKYSWSCERSLTGTLLGETSNFPTGGRQKHAGKLR